MNGPVAIRGRLGCEISPEATLRAFLRTLGYRASVAAASAESSGKDLLRVHVPGQIAAPAVLLDQSHFTKGFTRVERMPPGWRRHFN